MDRLEVEIVHGHLPAVIEHAGMPLGGFLGDELLGVEPFEQLAGEASIVLETLVLDETDLIPDLAGLSG